MSTDTVCSIEVESFSEYQGITLLDDSILVRVQGERTTSGGLVLPENALTIGTTKGEVVGVGPGELRDGVREEMDIFVGQWVLLSPHAGRDIRLDDTIHLLVKRKEIWMILNDPDIID